MTQLFHPSAPHKSERSKRFYARVEIAYTLVDFTAALCFIIGSVLFFWPAYEIPGVWLFLIGSIFFAVKPTLRLYREIKLARMGDDDDLAGRL